MRQLSHPCRRIFPRSRSSASRKRPPPLPPQKTLWCPGYICMTSTPLHSSFSLPFFVQPGPEDKVKRVDHNTDSTRIRVIPHQYGETLPTEIAGALAIIFIGIFCTEMASRGHFGGAYPPPPPPLGTSRSQGIHISF